MLFKQCCVCRLPEPPQNQNRYEITHGYHRECFIRHHEKDFDKEEMDEILRDNKFVEEE